ncbi:MAG: SIMPL domain-containing protein [Pirellula sp.]
MLIRSVQIAIVFVTLMLPAFAQSQRTVSVTGNAETEVMPDIAVIRLAIETVDASIANAKSKTDAAVVEFSKTLQQLGLKSENIIRSSLRIGKQYPDDEDYSKFVFNATRTISIKAEVSEVAKILDKAIATGVNEVEGIEYAISDDSKIRQKLLGEAIENAKEQAGFLAKAFDAKLGKVQRITSDRFGGSTLSLLMRAPVEANDTAYTPDPIKVSRSVDVVFELVE